MLWLIAAASNCEVCYKLFYDSVGLPELLFYMYFLLISFSEKIGILDNSLKCVKYSNLKYNLEIKQTYITCKLKFDCYFVQH